MGVLPVGGDPPELSKPEDVSLDPDRTGSGPKTLAWKKVGVRPDEKGGSGCSRCGDPETAPAQRRPVLWDPGRSRSESEELALGEPGGEVWTPLELSKRRVRRRRVESKRT